MVMRLKSICFTYFCCFAVLASWGISSAGAVPSLETHPETTKAVVNEPYSLVFEVSWRGDPSEYASVAPTLNLDDWGAVSDITTSTHVEDGKNIIRHTIAILPTETGSFSIPETAVAYFAPADIPGKDKNGETPAFTYPTLQAGILSVTVREPTDYLLNSVIIAGFGIVLFSFALVFHRRNALRIAQSSDYLVMTVPSLIHDAKKRRLDEDYYAFFQGLLRGAGLLKDSGARTRLQKRYEELALSTGYKGVVPSDEQLNEAVEALEWAYRSDGESSSS